MRKRSAVAVTMAAIMVVSGCGGGSGALSEDDFVDALAELCSDTDRDLERIDDPTDAEATEDFAAEAADILTAFQEDLADIKPPEDFERDFGRFQGVVDDFLEQLADLEDAAKDEDDEAIDEGFTKLAALVERATGFAEDMDVEECAFGDNAATDTTVEETTTVPPTTAPPLTLPPTLPPQTAPPATAAPATDPPIEGALFSVVDLSPIFNPPEGFEIIDSDAETAQPFIDVVAAEPLLNIFIEEMGVGAIADEFGALATLVVGIAVEGTGMPAEWKNLLCDPATSEIQTTAGGITGVFCAGVEGSGVFEIFTLTDGDIGVTIATVDPTFAAADLIDLFFFANA